MFVLAGVLGLALTLGAFLTRSYRLLSKGYSEPSDVASVSGAGPPS